MSDLAISALPSASLPLAGTELVPLVQGGVTCRVAASHLGAGGGPGPVAEVYALIPSGSIDNYAPAGFVAGITNRLILTPTDSTSVILGIAAASTDGFAIDIICNPGSALPVKLQNDSSATPGNDIYVPGASGVYDIPPGVGATLKVVQSLGGMVIFP